MKRILPLVVAVMLLAVSLPSDINANSPPGKPTLTGTTNGETGNSYTYTMTSTDPDGDRIYYCVNWGDGNEFCTDMMDSGTTFQASHAWESDGTYTITVTATDEHDATSEPATLSVTMPLSINLNNPPGKPTLTGTTNGETGNSYTYTMTSTDPDGDRIYYCVNWGDGNEFCTDMMDSGTTFQASHAWESDGTYTITVTATDEHDATSEPATLSVTMPLTNEVGAGKIKITKPRYGIYLFGIRVMPLLGQVVIGDVNVKVNADSDISRVEFLLMEACGCGRKVMHTDVSAPFEWQWDQDYDDEIMDEGFIQLTVRGYTQSEEYGDSISLYKVKL